MANSKYVIDISAKDKTKGALSSVDKGLDKASRRALMFKGALGLAAGVMATMGAMRVFGKVIDEMDELAKAAKNAGVQTDLGFAKFQVLQKWMGEAGIDAGSYARSLNNINVRMREGLEGNKTYAGIMEKLGGDIFDANGQLKDSPSLLLEVMKAMEAGNITVDEAAKLLGIVVGPKIQGAVEALATNNTTLSDSLVDVADSMNLIDFEQAGKAEAFNDAMGRLGTAFNDFLVEAITPLLPGLTRFIEGLVEKAPGYLETFKGWLDKMEPAFSLIGGILDSVVIPAFQLISTTISGLSTVLKPLLDILLPGIEMALEFVTTVLQIGLEQWAAWATFLKDTVVAAVQAVIDIVKTVITNFGDWDQVMEDIKAIAVEMKDKVVEAFQVMEEKLTAITDATIGKIGDTWDKFADWLWRKSLASETKDAMIHEFEEMGVGLVKTTDETTKEIMSDYDKLAEVMKDKTKEMSNAVDDFTSDFNKSFNDILADGLVEGNLNFSNFAGLFKSTMKDLIADTLNGGNMLNNILGGIGTGKTGSWLGKAISGAIGWLTGGIGGAVAGLFGGGNPHKAAGGPVTGGKNYIVGEKGPEMFSPGRNGQITSNADLGGGLTVNFNLSSIDSRSGTEFIIEQKKQIIGMINQAYKKRGKQGIY